MNQVKPKYNYIYIEMLNIILLTSIIFGVEIYISQYSNPATEVKFYYLGIINSVLMFFSVVHFYITGKKTKFFLGNIFITVVIYFFITSSWSEYRHVSYRAILTFFTFLILYYNFVYNIDSDVKIKFLLTVLITVTSGVCFFGLLQFAGYDFYKWGRVYELFEDMNILRIISCQGNPNFLGVFIISVFPIFIVLAYKKFIGNIYALSVFSLLLLFIAVHFSIELFYQSNGIEINVELLLGIIMFLTLLVIYFIKKSCDNEILKLKILKYLPVINVFIFFVILFALFFTYNRGGYVGFIVELAILFFFQRYYFKKKILTKSVIKIFCCVLGLFFIIYFLSYNFSHKIDLVAYRLLNVSNFQQPDVKIRFYLWQVALNVIRQNYWFGTGIGTFMNYFPSEITENWKYIFPKPDMIVESAHSELLEILLETGVIGLLIVIIMLYRVFHLNIKLIKVIEDDFYKYLSVGILASLCGILTHALFETKFRYASTVVPAVFYIAIIEYLASKYLYSSKCSLKNNITNPNMKSFFVIGYTGIAAVILILLYLKPLASNIYNNFASIEVRVNKESFDTALEYFDKSLFFDEYNEISLYTKLRVYDYKRDYTNAEKTVFRLMSISPFFKDINQIYGDILLKQNKINEANYFINKGLKVSQPFDSYYLLKSQSLIQEKKYELAEELLKKNYYRIENKGYLNYMLGKISEMGNMKVSAYENYRNSIKAGIDNSINYYNFGIFLLKEKKIDEGIFYLYLARIIDSQKRSITPAFWMQVFNKLNPNFVLSNQIKPFTKIMYVNLKLMLSYLENTENDINNLKMQFLNTEYKEHIIYLELKMNYIKNRGFSKNQIEFILNNEISPELVSAAVKQLATTPEIHNYFDKILQKISLYAGKDKFNIALMLNLAKDFESAGIPGASEKIKQLVNNVTPKNFKNEKYLNSFGIVGFDFKNENVNSGEIRKILLYFGIDNSLPLKIKGHFEIGNDTYHYVFKDEKEDMFINLEEYNSGDVVKKYVDLRFDEKIPTGEYNLKFIYKIEESDTLYNDNLLLIKNEFVYVLSDISVTGDKNKELERRADYCIKNMIYEEAADIYFNKLPYDYKDTDIIFQFNKYKLIVLKKDYSAAEKQKNFIVNMGNKIKNAVPVSIINRDIFDFYWNKIKFIDFRHVKKSVNPDDYDFVNYAGIFDYDLCDLIYKNKKNKPVFLNSEDNVPIAYYFYRNKPDFQEQLFFIKSWYDSVKNDLIKTGSEFKPNSIYFINSFINELSVSRLKNKIEFIMTDFYKFLYDIAINENSKSTVIFNGENLLSTYNFINCLNSAGKIKEAESLFEKIDFYNKNKMDYKSDIVKFYLKSNDFSGNKFPYKYFDEINDIVKKHSANQYITKNILKISDKYFLLDDSNYEIYGITNEFKILQKDIILYPPNMIKVKLKLKFYNLFPHELPVSFGIGYLDYFSDFINIDTINIYGNFLKNEIINSEKLIRIDEKLYENIKNGKCEIKINKFCLTDYFSPFIRLNLVQ